MVKHSLYEVEEELPSFSSSGVSIKGLHIFLTNSIFSESFHESQQTNALIWKKLKNLLKFSILQNIGFFKWFLLCPECKMNVINHKASLEHKFSGIIIHVLNCKYMRCAVLVSTVRSLTSLSKSMCLSTLLDQDFKKIIVATGKWMSHWWGSTVVNLT